MSEESDDRLLREMGRAVKQRVCRARYKVNGRTHICVRPKGHPWFLRANGGHKGPPIT